MGEYQMKPRCICVGNMTIDDLVFYDGTSKMGVLGGDGVYAAIGASFWEAEVLLSAVAGPDYPVSQLPRSFDIDISMVITKDRPSLRNWGLYERDGSRQFVFRSPKAQWHDYTPLPGDLPPQLLRGAFVHVAPVPWELQINLVKHARLSGARFISIDPAYQFLDDISERELGRLVEHADAFLPSRQEVRAIYPGLNPNEALHRLVDTYQNLKVIIIKLGEDGAIGFDRARNQKFVVPAYRTLAVDPTGAGDSFCGGFIAGYALTEDPNMAVFHGAVSASFVVETEGTLGLSGISRLTAQERLEKLVPT